MKENAKYVNYGLALLKTNLALSVIWSDCSNNNSTKNKIILSIIAKQRHIHVPSFLVMSFYFKRLLISFILWPNIIFIMNNFSNNFLKIDLSC